MTTEPTVARRPWKFGPLEILAVGAIVLVVAQPRLVGLFDHPALQAGATVFVSIIVQALPFLVLGVLLSAAIAAFVPREFWQRALPANRVVAVPVAGAAGLLLPGCECASVPVAGSLMARGVTPAAALAFLLSAPAINPIVLVSTFVAFPRPAADGGGETGCVFRDGRHHGMAVVEVRACEVAAHARAVTPPGRLSVPYLPPHGQS